mmetsp:Transcript_5772/g.14787  ORF Transcript_5772/g.14787 Transcript_5772/m.14787 type:complete len:127 (-) Transcript_5772:261-641(-)
MSSALDAVQQAAVAVWIAVKRIFLDTRSFLRELTLKQAVALGAGFILLVVVLSNFLIGLWHKYLPNMLITLVRFLMFVLIPLVGAAGTVFGMFLEQRYEKFEDLKEVVSNWGAQVSNGFDAVKKRL